MMKISVITVCYNAVETIEKTMLSVLNQTYPSIEYIIIDGGSTDGTVDIIKKYADKLAYWISEPDKGIYDAMNKGIEKCTGEWVNFMNAGDKFVDNDIINKIGFEILPNHILYVYGDNLNLQENGCQTYKKSYPLSKISRGIICCHQSTFISTKFKDFIYFNTNYKISADYYQQLFIYKRFTGKSFYHLPFPISIYENEKGISSRAKLLLREEYMKIHLKNGYLSSIPYDLYHYMINIISKFNYGVLRTK